MMKTNEEKEACLRAKALRTQLGTYTNAVYPMTRILLSVIEKQKPTHMAVAWDVSRNTFRRRLYEDYKGHRTELISVLSEQFQTMQDVLKAMNISQFAMEEYEADDIIGTLAHKFESQLPVYIMTKDQDALQLITDRTRVWLLTSKAEELYKSRGIPVKSLNVPSGVFEYTPVTFEEEYQLKPSQMVDKKALEGDSSDNIPGVKGVGQKACIPLLQEFQTIEHLYDAIENMDIQSEAECKQLMKDLGIARSPLAYLLKESATELVGKQAAFLSKTLATIKTDIPELDSVEMNDLALNLNSTGIRDKFLELEFHSLLKNQLFLTESEEELVG